MTKPAFVCAYHNEGPAPELQWGIPELPLVPTTTTQTAYQLERPHPLEQDLKLFVVSPPALAYAPMSPDKPLKVLTINAFLYQSDSLIVSPFFSTPRVPERAKQFGRWIRQQDPDIVLIQEVWQEPWFKDLKKESGYPHAFHFGPDGSSDLAILSKYPLENPHLVPLIWKGSTYAECGKDIGFSFKFGLGLATVSYAGQEILVANTHPMHREKDEVGFGDRWAENTPERMAQHLEIVKILETHAGNKPVIFAGDFNFSHGHAEAEVVDQSLTKFTDTCRYFQEKYPGTKLSTYSRDNEFNLLNEEQDQGVVDHIYASPHFRIRHAKILSPHPTLSDHEFVMAHLSLESLDESNGFARENPLQDEEYHRLIDYFDHLSFHPYCWVSKIGSPQIEGIRAFLAQYDPSERPVGPVIIVQK